MIQALGFKNYKDYLKSYLWKSKAKWMKECFPNCYICGSSKRLEVHHKTYENIGNEKSQELLVLCRKCHKEISL